MMRSIVWLFGAALPLFAILSSTRAADRPNIVWIISDDHAAYVCGTYGNKNVRTPNIDRLAAQGMRFDRAYCNSPVCTASRQSFLTGRYPRTIGVTQLRTPLPEDETTFAEILKAEGYRTAAYGKMHFNSNLRHGFDERLDAADHRRHLQKTGRKSLPTGVEVLPRWRPFRDHAKIWLNGFYRPLGAVDEDMTSTWLARRAGEYLHRKDEQPFFLIVSFTEPHSPFHFPVEYHGRHEPSSFEVPQVEPDAVAQIPSIFRDLTDEDKQGIIASYYTSVEFMDKNVGLVLDALGKSGHDDDTVVMYFGDHGYMLGQHGRFEKHCCYEPAVRSPLIVRHPPTVKRGTATSAMVEFVDIVPTALEYAKVDVPKSVQGRSFRQVLERKSDKHRDKIFVEYSENEEAMVRTDRWKLVYSTGNRARQDGYATGRPSPGRTVQLFDMVNDSNELVNLAGEPGQVDRVREMTTAIAQHLKSTARKPIEMLPGENMHQFLGSLSQPRDRVR